MTVFINPLYHYIISFVPKINVRTSTLPSYLFRKLKELVMFKNYAHQKYESSLFLFDYHSFTLAHARCKFLSKQCYPNFIR